MNMYQYLVLINEGKKRYIGDIFPLSSVCWSVSVFQSIPPLTGENTKNKNANTVNCRALDPWKTIAGTEADTSP